jgi:ABC-type sulfate/molybdate transport systems ATPase subunit
MLEAHIVKRRRDFTVDVHLELKPGGCLALFGASGSGKSTVLSCIAGIEQPDDGFVRWDGVSFYPPPLPLHLRGAGYLTQDPYLFPHLTVERNIAFGLSPQKSEAETEWLERLRDSLGLADIWTAPASQISGGQARRAGVARMLARRPPLVLLDEPFNGLDRQLVRELLEALVVWRREIGFSMIVVDHESEILERLCSRVAVMARGRIVQEGSWADVRSAPVDGLLDSLLRPL